MEVDDDDQHRLITAKLLMRLKDSLTLGSYVWFD